jgi:ATP synthase protein I
MAENKKSLTQYLKYTTVGLELSLSVAVGALFGYWLDQKFGTEPWLMLFWLLCGIFAGFRALYRTTKKIMKESRQNDLERPD